MKATLFVQKNTPINAYNSKNAELKLKIRVRLATQGLILLDLLEKCVLRLWLVNSLQDKWSYQLNNTPSTEDHAT